MKKPDVDEITRDELRLYEKLIEMSDPDDVTQEWCNQIKARLGPHAYHQWGQTQEAWTEATYGAGEAVDWPRPWEDFDRQAREGWQQRIVDSCVKHYELPSIPVELLTMPHNLIYDPKHVMFAAFETHPYSHIVVAPPSPAFNLIHETAHYLQDEALQMRGFKEQWQRYMLSGHNGDFNEIFIDLVAREIGPDTAREYLRQCELHGAPHVGDLHCLATLTSHVSDKSAA